MQPFFLPPHQQQYLQDQGFSSLYFLPGIAAFDSTIRFLSLLLSILMFLLTKKAFTDSLRLLRSILFDTVICRIRKIKISHFQPCYNGNNFFYYCYNKDSRGSGMEDPRIISTQFNSPKMPYYNVLVNTQVSMNTFPYIISSLFFCRIINTPLPTFPNPNKAIFTFFIKYNPPFFFLSPILCIKTKKYYIINYNTLLKFSI